jgi:hypothetical protein
MDFFQSFVDCHRFWTTWMLFTTYACTMFELSYPIIYCCIWKCRLVQSIIQSSMISAGFKPFKNKYLMTARILILSIFKKSNSSSVVRQLSQQNQLTNLSEILYVEIWKMVDINYHINLISIWYNFIYFLKTYQTILISKLLKVEVGSYL